MDARSREEFREYVAAHSGALLRTATLLTGDRQMAEDLVQNALTRTYLHWGRIRDPHAVDAYTRRVMVNLFATSWRRKWRAEVPHERLPETADRDQYQQVDTGIGLKAALARLPRRQRAVVVLRYWEDQSEAEVAGLLDISVGTVKSQAAHGLAKLRADVDVIVLHAEEPR